MRIAKEHYVYAFDRNNAPVAVVKAPCVLTVETSDCFHGQLRSEAQSLDSLDFRKVNPATGPILVQGAEPGDALRVAVRDIRIGQSGVMLTIPGAGILPETVRGQTLLCPIENGFFLFKGVKLPLRPMIGVIGVAPAGEAVNCGTPGAHGGNMDCTGIRSGSTLYLPVFVEGGLLALGDLHAVMGDGEVSVSGLEISGEAELGLDLAKALNLPWPLLKTDSELAFLASAPSTDEALELSVRAMNAFLCAESLLNPDEALMLMSACGQARICQVVDPLKTARFCIPLDVLEKFSVRIPL